MSAQTRQQALHGGAEAPALPLEVDRRARLVARRRRPRQFDRPRFLVLFTGLVFLYLFVPIAVVVLFSFNSARSLQVFRGVSLRWYRTFLSDSEIVASLIASVEIALATVVVATVLGTLLAFALVRARSRWNQPANVLMLLPLVTPEIVTAVAALLLFTQLGLTLSMKTIVIAHITFSISYVTVIVRGRLSALNPEAEEAAMDLGATDLQALRLVTLPALWPAILASGLLVFVLSFDDFVTSFYTTGSGTPPLPVRIYSMIRYSVSPEINAIGTLMMVITLAAVLVALLLALRSRRGARNLAELATGG